MNSGPKITTDDNVARRLREVEEALQSNERNLSLIINTIPTHIYVLNTEGYVQYVNQAVMDYTGLSVEDVHQQDYRDRVIHPEDFQRVRAPRAAGLKRGVPFSTEQRVMRNDGQYRWFLVRYKPLLDEQGRIVRWYVAAFDIEDQKRAEGQLRRSEFHLAEGQRLSHVGSWSFNSSGFGYWSPELFLIHGLDPSGKTPTVDEYLGLVHPEDREFITKAILKMFVDGGGFDFTKRIVRPDGKIRRVRYVGGPATHGAPVQEFVGTGIDVTEQDQLTEELRRSEAFLAEGQRLSRTGSFCWRVETDEITWSEEVYRIFQFEPGTPVTLELIGSRVHPEDQAKLNDMIERARKAVSDFEYEHRLLMPGASVKYLHLTAHGIRDNERRLEYIGAIQDVTESKIAEEALTRARMALAHMSRVTTLSALTASIAHEINQPIAAAITSAGACLRWLNRDQPDVQRAREAAMRIEEDGKRAAEIITHLRAFYKKDVSPQREVVSVNDLVDEMLALLRSEADRHSVVMRTELATGLPSVSADRVLLQQVLMNLMLNGMEAMSERGGELRISTRREGGKVMVSVNDTGVGIPADKMEEIFNAFVTAKAEGTGMGLAISRTIIESHGGRLWATVNSGPGATFHFTLPTEPEA